MINTQGVKLPEAKLPKTFGPGNIHARLTGIFLQKPGFDEHLKPYYLVYNLEGVDQGPEFEGFLIDKNNQNGARYKGQVGQIKASYWPYKDGVNPKNPSQVFKRDDSIVTALLMLAKVLGKEEHFHQLNAPTIEQYVALASDLLSGDKYLAWCVAGKEYDNKQGYLNYDLFLPRADNGRYAFETLSASPSKLQIFDQAKHIVKKAAAKQVNNFEPSQNFNAPPQGGQPNFNGNQPAPQTTGYVSPNAGYAGQQGQGYAGHQPVQQQQQPQQQQAQVRQPQQPGFGGQQQQFGGQQQNNGFNSFSMPDEDDLPF